MNRNATKQLDPKEFRLASVPLFASADSQAIRRLASVVDEATAAPERILLKEGDRHQQIYVIESGAASVEVGGQQVAEVGPGAIVGELGFFLGEPATATVRATTELELMIIPHTRFEQVLADNPALLRSITTELARRLRATDAQLTV